MGSNRSIVFVSRAIPVLAAFVVSVGLSMSLGAGWARAQSFPLTARDYIGPSALVSQPASEPASDPERLLPAPSYCTPCLYYSGDFDAAGPNPDALINQNGVVGGLAQTFTPFTVPSGHTWYITGLLINTLSISSTGTHSPKKAGWSIWRGVSAGTAGTLVFAGANKATFTPTGRTLLGVYTEYTVHVALSQPITLGAGEYFVNVMPQCTDPTACSGQLFYESDVEDALPAHHHGPANLVDSSFFNSSAFTLDYVAASSQGAGLDLFSFGVIGTCAVTATASACSF